MHMRLFSVARRLRRPLAGAPAGRAQPAGMPSASARACPARARARRPSTGQLRFLLGWAYADAAAAAARPAALGLLRAVLARRLVLPEVYDLMGRVQDAMVQAQARARRPLVLGPPPGDCGGQRGACRTPWCRRRRAKAPAHARARQRLRRTAGRLGAGRARRAA